MFVGHKKGSGRGGNKRRLTTSLGSATWLKSRWTAEPDMNVVMAETGSPTGRPFAMNTAVLPARPAALCAVPAVRNDSRIH
jgi:tRNA U34 5-methylaminomethyl-2-thiouridine-forming methyltransferase MnmC